MSVVPKLWHAYSWGTQWTGLGCAKIILVMAKNTQKKGVKIKSTKTKL
jgi:hypothetical protein